MTRPGVAALTLAVAGLCLFTQASCDKAENPLAPANTVLTLTAVPSQIPLSGAGSRITVIGVRPDGNPIVPGTQITLTTSLGVLRPAGVACSDPAVVDIIEADGQGRAVAQLCGDGRIGNATVTARLTSAGGGGGGGGGGGDGDGNGAPPPPTSGASATVTIRIGQSDDSDPSVLIIANPSVIAVGGQSTLSLIGRNADNTPVQAGSRIRLIADLGTLRCAAFACPGEGSNPCNAVCTDSRGEAEATFIAGDRSGTAIVTAILGTGMEATEEIDINAAIDSLTLSVSPNSVARSDAGEEVMLEAILIDSLGNPLSGVLVRFNTERGALNPLTATTNAQGIATSTLTVTRADVMTIPANGTFTVSASATSEGQTRTDSREITVLGSP